MEFANARNIVWLYKDQCVARIREDTVINVTLMLLLVGKRQQSELFHVTVKVNIHFLPIKFMLLKVQCTMHKMSV